MSEKSLLEVTDGYRQKHESISHGWLKALLLVFLQLGLPLLVFGVIFTSPKNGPFPGAFGLGCAFVVFMVTVIIYLLTGRYEWLKMYWLRNLVGYYLVVTKDLKRVYFINFLSEVDPIEKAQILLPLGGWFSFEAHVYWGDKSLNEFWKISGWRGLFNKTQIALLGDQISGKFYQIGERCGIKISEMLQVITFFPNATRSIEVAERGYRFACDILKALGDKSRLGPSTEGRDLRREFALRFRDILPPDDKCWEEFDY